MHSTLFTFARCATALMIVASISSCKPEDEDKLDIPTTYEFTRNGSTSVDYSGQTERLNMLQLMTNYMKTSNTVGAVALDEEVLSDMFSNSNGAFQGQFSKNLRSKCFLPDTGIFDSFIQKIAVASQATGIASEGVAGVLIEGSTDPEVGYRVDENGIEHIQLIEKGLIGAVFFYQAMEVYLSQDRMGSTGNDELVDGENYTNMEHYFDEAFGYFGAPADFPNPVSLGEVRFWAHYCNSRNSDLYQGINNELSLSFRTARAAIAAKDFNQRDQAIQNIAQKWSIVIGSTAVDYLNRSLSSTGIPVFRKHHALSEAIAFMMCMKYHFNGGNSKFPPHYTYSHVEQALALIGPNTNLYQVTDQQIEQAIGHIKMAFPTGDIK